MPVRVTDLRGVDLARMRFDWDLTFAVLLAEPDGTILHRYGARDERGASTWLSAESFARVLRVGLETHARHPRTRSGATTEMPGPPLRLEEVPSYARKDKGECIHCHSVYPALLDEARAAGRFAPDDVWVYPPPGRIGIDLDRSDPERVVAVFPGSPAARAGLVVGDRLVRAGEQRIASAGDLMAVLEELPAAGARVALEVLRAGEARSLTLELAPGWRAGTPLELSWRPLKWALVPEPGFGGPLLGPDELEAAGLSRAAFAFRIGYFVTWGENARFGRAAREAGLREGDLFLGTSTQPDFLSVDHFHAWWRLTRRAGETVELVVWRDGAERRVRLVVLE